MKSAPRLLPLVAVAVGGVMAVKALSGVSELPDLLSAGRAWAEGPPAKAAASAKPTAATPAAQTSTPTAAPKPQPVCAPSLSELAKEASLSPSELQTLQSLQARRGQLDQREKDIDTKLQLLSAASLKLDAKLRGLQALKAEMQGLMGQGDGKTAEEVDRLVKVYEKMKPRDAGAIMATLDDRVRIPVASKMKEAALAAILAQMPTAEAKHLTEALAGRYTPEKAAENVRTATQQAAPRPAAAAAPADPLDDPADADAAEDAAAKPAKGKPAARRVARRPAAPRRKSVPTAVIVPPAAAPKPVEPARVAAAKPSLPAVVAPPTKAAPAPANAKPG